MQKRTDNCFNNVCQSVPTEVKQKSIVLHISSKHINTTYRKLNFYINPSTTSRSHNATAASQVMDVTKPYSMYEPPLTSHTKWRVILAIILHHNKGIETCFSRHRNLTTAKERHTNMFQYTQKPYSGKACKHVFVGTKIYFGPNPNLASHLGECIINRETMHRTQ